MKKDISVQYIRFEDIVNIEEVVAFCGGIKWKYESEGEYLEIRNKYESISVWLGGYVVLLYNKPVFLNERQFDSL